MRHRILIAAALTAMSATNCFAANAVQNGTFDNLSGWTWSAGTGGNEATRSGTTTRGVVDTNSANPHTLQQLVNLAVGQYTLSFDAFATQAGSSLNFSLASAVSPFTSLVSDSFTGLAISTGATPRSYSFNVTSAGNYLLSFAGLAQQGGGAGANNVAVDNVGINNVAAVPGPEAGAGLAGLAMAGVGAFMIRRRKQLAA